MGIRSQEKDSGFGGGGGMNGVVEGLSGLKHEGPLAWSWHLYFQYPGDGSGLPSLWA